VLNYSLSTKPLLLVPIGLSYFALYYGLFRWCIVRFGLQTPGREAETAAWTDAGAGAGETTAASGWVRALGGAGNLRSVEACTTRLRLVVADHTLLDEMALKALGSRGVLRLTDDAVQVVVGPIADQLASEIRAALRTAPGAVSAARAAIPPAPAPLSLPVAITDAALQRVIQALGGRANISGVRLNSSRLCVSLRDPEVIDESALGKTVRAIARPAPGSVHLIFGPDARAWAAALEAS
jgi:PTS system N-acetylglucosamine-specific IIC component